ncbi:MAG TPA: hypothetical protein VFK76_02830 [Gaiellaceae bacterium]|nr:hypothetical protein [Gaiellaceae bacterium]
MRVTRELRFERTVALAGTIVTALALVAAGCGGSSSKPTAEETAAKAPACPAGARVSWQKLANEIRAPVYCPSWLPRPLVGRWAGSPFNGHEVDPDRSYLVKFLWFDSGLGAQISEVHVNLRGYPGNSRIPTCDNTLSVNGKTLERPSPCFSDPKPQKKKFGKIVATLYTSNQGADQWHLLYAWHRNGSLYSLSEHVAAPYTYKQVVANLDRMMRTLVLVEPKAKSQT